MDYHPGETYCSQICQHPTCWEGHRLEERGLFWPVDRSNHKETLYEGLPTQKIVNMSMELDDLPYDDDSTTPVSIGPGFPVAFMDRIFKQSKPTDHCAASKGIDSDRPRTEIKKAGIHTLHAEDLIGDSSEAVVPNKYYIWVPRSQKTSELSRNLLQTVPGGGKMSVKTISVNTSQPLPTHRFEPSAHSLRLRQKSQFSASVRMRSSKENSSFESSNLGLEPHYVSLNSSALDQRSLPGVLSRAPTITLPDSSLPVHRSLSHPLSGPKNASTNILMPIKQVERDNANAATEVDPLGKSLPRIDATKYGRTKSNLVKQTKLSSILLEPCFDFCQRKSWTSGMINYGSNKLNLEPPVSATHQQDSTEDDPDFLDAQKWFKIEAQPLHSGPRSIRVPFGHQNQSSSLDNNTARQVTTPPPITTPTAGIAPSKTTVNELTDEKSGSTAKAMTRSATLSPLRRTTSKVVTFAPSSRSLSSCSISLTKTPNTRKNTAETSVGFRPSAELPSRKDESNHSDQPAQPPYPPPPSPELKTAVQDAEEEEEASEGPVFLVDRGDSESVITITARPPTNFEDESLINTPAGQGSLGRSRESTRDRLTRRASEPQFTGGMEETDVRKISISLPSKSPAETSGPSPEGTQVRKISISLPSKSPAETSGPSPEGTQVRKISISLPSKSPAETSGPSPEGTQVRKTSISLPSKSPTETSRPSPEGTHSFESALNQLASELVAEVVTSACYNLTKVGSINNGDNEVEDDNHTIASSQNPVDKSTELLPDMNNKATNILESPKHCPDSAITNCPQPLQPQHNALDQFDATEDDFKKELYEEYNKL